MELAEEQGLGIKSMRTEAQKLGLPLPRYTWEDPYLVLILYRTPEGAIRVLPPNVLESLNKEEIKGWEFLATTTSCSRAEYEQHMEIDKRKAQRHLKRFIELGLLRKVGVSSATTYEVVQP